MGYTHYWYRKRNITKKDWEKLINDFNKILPKFKKILDTKTKDNKLIVDNKLIYFNGIGQESHEPFVFERIFKDDFEQERYGGLLFSFCKTAVKPYDIAVTSALIIAKQILGNKIRVYSDGENSDWTKARQLVQNVLGYGQDFQLNENEEVEK